MLKKLISNNNPTYHHYGKQKPISHSALCIYLSTYAVFYAKNFEYESVTNFEKLHE